MPTANDTERLAQQNQDRLVPEGPAPTGSTLQIVSQMPFRYDWSQPPAGPVIRYHGNPNGELNAPISALAVDIDTPMLYINTDGGSSWRPVGGAGAGATDLFADSTGVDPSTETAQAVPWVATTGSPFIVGPGNVIPVAPGGVHSAEVQVAGFYVVSISIQLVATVDTYVDVELGVTGSGPGPIKGIGAGRSTVIADSSFYSFNGSVAFAGEVGDLIQIVVNPAGAMGTITAALAATVASLV